MRGLTDSIRQRLNESWKNSRRSVWMFVFFSIVTFGLQVWHFNSPLLGSHGWRQADTLFTGYFFCKEDSNIMHPRIAQRELTDGIAIGEFPLYSWLASVPCQLTGNWSEGFPKLLSWLLFWCSSLLFSLALVRKWGRKESFFEFATLLLCAELTLTFFTRPLPDVMAFFLISLAGFIWTGARYPSLFSTRYMAGLILATTGFLIRPYLVPLAFFVLPFGVFRWIVLGLSVNWAYNWWFIEHTQISSVGYYLITRKPFLEAWTEIPASIWPLIQQTAKDHLNYILIPFFFLGFFRRFLTGGFWWFSILLLLFVSGKHFSAHPYYMTSACVLALCMAWSCLPKTPSFRAGLIFCFGLIGVANSQHHFHDNKDQHGIIVRDLARQKTEPQDKVVTLTTMGNQIPILLYYAKRTGWSLIDTTENRARACELPVKLRILHDATVLPNMIQELSCAQSQ